MNKRSLLHALTLCAGLLSQAYGAQNDELSIMIRSPLGDAGGKVTPQAVTVSFNRPMMALGSQWEIPGTCPIRVAEMEKGGSGLKRLVSGILPGELFREKAQVSGRCRWTAAQTLSFEPSAPFKAATRYQVTVKGGTRSEVVGTALAKDDVWQFDTPKPVFIWSYPAAGARWVEPGAAIFLAFSQEMDPQKAAGYVTLEEAFGGAARPAALRRPTNKELESLGYDFTALGVSSASVLAVKPDQPFGKDKIYYVRLAKGLPGAQGYLGMANAGEVKLESTRVFKLSGTILPTCAQKQLKLFFSNPVKYSEVLKHLKAEPPVSIPEPDTYEAESTGGVSQYGQAEIALPGLELAPNSTYTFTLDRGLADVFGGKLGEDASFTLANNDYCSELTMPDGFGVLESYLPPRHPASAMNVLDADVTAARVELQDFIPFYKSGYGEEKLLKGASAYKWSPAKKLNVSARAFLDFSPLAPKGGGGFMFARVDYPKASRQFKVMDDVTGLGLTVKSSRDSTLVWTTFLKTGKPASGVEVELRDNDNKVLWRGKSGRGGLADAPGWKALGVTSAERWSRPFFWVFARHKSGPAVLSTKWDVGVEPWRFGISYNWNPRAEEYRGSLFTERGVYRPGETVYLKGVVRKLEKGDWADSGLKDMEVRIKDPRGALVKVATVTLSADYSSFDYAYDLKEEAPTGVWSLEVNEAGAAGAAAGGDVVRVEGGDEDEDAPASPRSSPKVDLEETFRVEAFKPASFEVKTVPSKESFMTGEPYAAVVDGWYLFGAPMEGTTAEWTLRLEPASYTPPGLEQYDFTKGWFSVSPYYGKLVASGSGALDAQGRLEVSADLPAETAGPNAYRAVFEAGVMDAERQRLFGRSSTLVHKAAVYPGIKESTSFLEAGKPWKASVVAASPDGALLAGVPLHARLVRRQWLSAQRVGVHGRLEWYSETRDAVVSEFDAVSSSAPYEWNYTPDQPGSYAFSVSALDPEGRAAESESGFYVIGKGGGAWWGREDSDIVELVADKKTYKPGDTARIMVKSPYDSAQALVTIEREGILDRWTQEVQGGADFIDVPVKEKYLPNAYVSVTLLRGRSGKSEYSEDGAADLAKPQAKFGYASLRVDPGGRRLKVAVKTDAAKYRPGATVRVDLDCSDEAGKGAQAEVTLYAVDEGVLSLTGYATPDLFSGFYGPRQLAVGTADNRLHVIGQRNFGEKGENRGGGGGMSLAGVDLRADFRPTAYWNASVKTDGGGHASAEFKLPDSLTRFRVMAVAGARKRFGAGEAQLTVSKPLMLKPVLPRLARVGDEFEGGVVIHNYSQQASTVSVSLEMEGDALLVSGEPFVEVTVPPGKAKEVSWHCTGAKTGDSVFKFRAAAGAETDGLRWEFPVRVAEAMQHYAVSGVAAPESEQLLRRPADAREGLGELLVTLSASAMSDLAEGARFLLHYPYGCLEQRTSGALPVITGADFIETFKLGDLKDLKAAVQKVYDRIGSYQAPSGGFAYWPNPADPDPYVTAYALEGAHLARKEGYKVDPEVLGRAVRWLKSYTDSEDKRWAYPYSYYDNRSAKAYAVYVLSLYGEDMGAAFSALYASRGDLPLTARAHLLKAAPLLTKDKEITGTLADELLSLAKTDPVSMYFEDNASYGMYWTHYSRVKATAVALQALLEARGGFDGDQKAVKWLINQRRPEGYWQSTQENAWVLRAFQDYYRRYEKEAADFGARVAYGEKPNQRELWSREFKGRTLEAETRRFEFTDIFNSSDSLRLGFSKSGPGRLYYSLRMGYVPASYETPVDAGFRVSKEITPLNGGSIFRAGARAVVTLTVYSGGDRSFVALNDPVPAGFEIVDTSFATGSGEEERALRERNARESGEEYYWWWGGFHRSEKYDDRILVFSDYLSAGEHKYSYLVQAVAPGVFTVPATHVEAMYEPEVFGRTASSKVEIVR